MSFRKLVFELNEEQLSARNELGKKLLEMDVIRKFQKTYSCPDEVIVENASRFKRWVQELEKIKMISEQDIEKDEMLGQYIDLVYDSDSNILSEVDKRLPLFDEIQRRKQYLNQYQIVPISENLEQATFENLQVNLDKESKKYQEVVKKLFAFSREKDVLGYYLFGDIGVGKTFLGACVTNEFAKKGKSVALLHVPSFINLLKDQFNNGSVESILRTVRYTEVLVLDDLGAEPITPWSRDEILLTILNDRLENKRKTIITSNYPPELLVDLYKVDSRGVSDTIRARRLVDRITALTLPCEISGKNRRIQQKR